MSYDARDSAEIRKLILLTLEEIREIIPIDFKVEVKPQSNYGEDIIMILPPEASDITITEGSKNGNTFSKTGPRIIFHQIFSDGSEVSFKMSHIINLTEEAKTELQDKVPRIKVTRTYILENVLAFLKEVLRIEKE